MSPRTRCGVQCVSHPALRCGVQCVSHPAPRCGVQWRESPRTTMRGPVRGRKREWACWYSLLGYFWIPRRAPGHPALRCGVQWRVFPGYRVVARYDVVAGSRKVPLVGIAFARIPGFRIKCGMTGRVFLDSASHRVTPHHDAGSSKGPQTGMGLPVFHARVFLDSASSAE